MHNSRPWTWGISRGRPLAVKCRTWGLSAALAMLFAAPAAAQFGISQGYFAVDDAGEITVTEEGAAAINAQIGDTTFYLNLDAQYAQGAPEPHYATIHTCCTPTPRDGPLSMPWVIYKWTKPAQFDTGMFQAASATVELFIDGDLTQVAEPATISFDGAVKWTCTAQPPEPPTPIRWCLYPGIEWNAVLGNAHVIEGQVRMLDGSVHKTTLQIPASFRLTLFWSPTGDNLVPVSDDVQYRSQAECVARAQLFFTAQANPQGLIKHYQCEAQQ